MTRRLLFTFAAAVSLLLCAATVLFWGTMNWNRRYRQIDLWDRYAVVPDNTGVMVWPLRDTMNHPEPVAFVPYLPTAISFAILPALWLLIRNGLFHRQSGCCKQCGYNLTGNISGICPECGTAIRREAETVT